MKSRAPMFAAVVFAATFAAATFAQGLAAVRAATPPKLDGVLDDACWKAASPAEKFVVMDTDTPSPLKTTARFVYDDDTLYIAVECFTPDLALVKAERVKKDTGGIINGSDSVEVMIDCRGDANEYVHLATNASGSQFDRRVGQGGWVAYDWDGDWRSASKLGADSYTVEMGIPFYELGINAKTTDKSWRVNVCRNVRMPGTSAYTSLAERGAYNTPARFRPLAGINADFTRYWISISPVRVTTRFADKKTFATIEVDATNDSAAPRNLSAEDWLIESEQKVLVKDMGAFTLEPGTKKTLSFGPFELTQSGKFQNRVALNDAKTRRPLAVSSSALEIICVPIAMRVVEPFYRNTIFATQKIEKVVAEVDVGLDEAARAASTLNFVVLTADGQKTIVEKTLRGPAAVNRFEFDTAQLPAEGKYILKVALRDNAGAELANTEQMLLKLPYKKGEVWFGRDLVFRIDGKPFFPNGSWGMMTPARNFLLYGIFKERAHHEVIPGKYKVWYFTSGEDHKTELEGTKPFSEEFIKDFRGRIRDYRDDPDILAWVSVDEPECSNILPAKLQQLYEICREEDPYHPVWVSNDSAEGVQKYAGCADAAVPHPYPAAQPDMPIGDFTPVLNAQRAYLEFTGYTKPVGYMHQGFNYGEYVRGRRMPTYYELRNQNILCLADGGTFLMGFESSVIQDWYPEISIGMDYLTQEFAYLGRAVCAPKSPNKVTTDKDVVTLLKTADGDLFLFVSNASNEPRKLTVTVEGLDAKKMAVVSEGRNVELKAGVINDAFNSWETHIYTTSMKDSGLKTIQAITALIEAEYAKRHKPGNLAFQRWSNGSVDISASSRAGEYPPEPWHICDGITDPSGLNPRFANEFTWTDGTPNESPDWVALKFPKAHKINRVAVYMTNKSVNEYKIQVMRGADWVDVAQGGNTEAVIDKSFAPVTSDQVRLLVTATNGPNAIVTEMEVYGE